jgi:hypothetical protein
LDVANHCSIFFSMMSMMSGILSPKLFPLYVHSLFFPSLILLLTLTQPFL